MPRRTNTTERRAQIVAALKTVMAERGYDRASVGSIAKAAGLTPGLVHYHFGNKHEILLEMLGEMTRAHEARTDQELELFQGDTHAQIERFVDLHLGLGATADPETLACWVLTSGEALRDPDVRQVYAASVQTWVDRLASLITEGTAAGQLACPDAPAAAAALVAAIQGYFVLAATARATIPHGSAARSVLAMADGLLRPTSRPFAPETPR